MGHSEEHIHVMAMTFKSGLLSPTSLLSLESCFYLSTVSQIDLYSTLTLSERRNFFLFFMPGKAEFSPFYYFHPLDIVGLGPRLFLSLLWPLRNSKPNLPHINSYKSYSVYLKKCS